MAAALWPCPFPSCSHCGAEGSHFLVLVGLSSWGVSRAGSGLSRCCAGPRVGRLAPGRAAGVCGGIRLLSSHEVDGLMEAGGEGMV